jgi:hypothetical protein
VPFGYAEWADLLCVLCVFIQIKVMHAAVAARPLFVLGMILPRISGLQKEFPGVHVQAD